MEETNKQVVTITDEGIICIDYLVADYTVLINLIEKDNCMLMFDSEEAYQNLVNGIINTYVKIVLLNLEKE